MAGARQELAAALGQAPESGGCVAGLDPGAARQHTISRAIDPAVLPPLWHIITPPFTNVRLHHNSFRSSFYEFSN